VFMTLMPVLARGVRTLLSASLLNLVRHAVSYKPVVWLELLGRLLTVVDERETGALAATVLCSETEDRDTGLVCLVQLGQLASEVVLGNIWAVGVEDITALQ